MILKALHINPMSRKTDGRRQVLAHLCEKLRTERRFLGMPYFTWWFEYGALEIFEPINGLMPRSLWGEWEVFLEEGSPDLIASIQEHDAAVEGLRDACAALQRCLESSKELRHLYDKHTAPQALAELETDLKTLFGARPPENHLSYLAQLIVNGTPPDCSPLYTIRPLWLRSGEEFLALRDAEAFHPEVARVSESARRLDNALERLDYLCESPDVDSVEHIS